MPIFLGLYRSLTSFSTKGYLKGGFYFIPDLTGPNTLIGKYTNNDIVVITDSLHYSVVKLLGVYGLVLCCTDINVSALMHFTC